MKILFLGTAQDGGIPHVGCQCYNCHNVRRNASSIALLDGSDTILIDITPDFREQYQFLAEKFDARIRSIYLTHAHWGHYGGLMQLGKEGWAVKNMPIYLTEKFHNFLTSNQPFAYLFYNSHLLPKFLHDGIQTDQGIVPISVPHRDEYADTCAFLIDLNGKQVLYMPDVDRIDSHIEQLIRSVDLSIIDGTFYRDGELNNRDMSAIPHPRISDSVSRFGDIAEKIIFTHLNHSNPAANLLSEEYKYVTSRGIRIANDGDVLE